MERILENYLNIMLLVVVSMLLVFTGLGNYLGSRLSYLALYLIILLSHFTLDSKRSTLFVVVISLFMGSTILGVVAYAIKNHKVLVAFTISAFSFFGYLLIFISLLRQRQLQFRLNKSLFWVIPIAGATCFVSYELFQFLESYELSGGHLVYLFFFTIFKIIILSLGIIIYLGNTRKYRKMVYLNWTMAFLFCGDFVDIITSLFFAFESLPVVQVLINSFFCCALLFFYLYCTEPKELSSFEMDY